MTKLMPIISQKQHEVQQLKMLLDNQPNHVIADVLRGKIPHASRKIFKEALRRNFLAVIAEIKRKSPSKGSLATIADPVSLAKSYIAGGASAISVLTDTVFFGGSLGDLTKIAAVAHEHAVPVLRKDFIIDEIQIAEAVAAGSDAVLFIVAVLGKDTQVMLNAAKAMGIEVLVEVHNPAELEIALASDAEIIGVNNRNLETMQVDTEQALRLLASIPKHIVKVAESGIHNPLLAQEYYRAGFDAVLIGEALVTSGHPENFIRACRHDD